MNERWADLHPGGLVEAASVMGLTKQAAARALKRGPAHLLIAELAMGPLYDLDAVEAWNMNRKKTPGPRLADSLRSATQAMQGMADAHDAYERSQTTVTVERTDQQPTQAAEIER
ncbi:hypothetical protein [Streptomyces sp. NPDC057302]|uniref:hypothetical protein n=1 Tax=Streptomyces sp. NPDC057302 TaxID=3346094 RepID=UPI0036341424